MLVTIDTLRADHVGAYGYPRDTTPFLDQLARRGVLFERAVSASSHTAPSHASLMTALQPFQHGVVKNGQRLGDQNHTMAELLGAAGYHSAAFTSVKFLGEICQGFDVVDANWRNGERTVDAAIAWLDQRRADPRPFFLWVHLYDPHALKGPRKELAADVERLRSASAEARAELARYVKARGVPADYYPNDEILLSRYDVYDAGIRFADRQIERLYNRVEAGSPARWVVTSDHGEGLGNHRYDEHDKYLYDEQVLVPLIVAGVDEVPRRVTDQVRLVDVYPTVAEWIGAKVTGAGGAALQGYPLFSPARVARDLPRRLAFSQRRLNDRRGQRLTWVQGDLFSLRTQSLKYVYSSHGKDELYDLAADPYELVNLLSGDAERAASLRRVMLAYVPAGRDTLERAPGADDETEHDAELKALGYL